MKNKDWVAFWFGLKDWDGSLLIDSKKIWEETVIIAQTKFGISRRKMYRARQVNQTNKYKQTKAPKFSLNPDKEYLEQVLSRWANANQVDIYA